MKDLCEQICGKVQALHVLGLVFIEKLAQQVPHDAILALSPRSTPNWILQMNIEIAKQISDTET